MKRVFLLIATCLITVSLAVAVMAATKPVSKTTKPPAKAKASTPAKQTKAAVVTKKAAPAKGTKSAQQPKPAALPKLVDLGRGTCIPCKMMKPVLEELTREYKGKLEVVYVDITENPDAVKSYGIRSIPTQVFYDAKGKELSRHEGFFPKADIIARFKEHKIDLRK